MTRRLARSLSFRLLVIFLLLGGLFVYGTFVAIRWFYNSDDIRGLISGHLSLHVQYVREDIGSPPRIDRAVAITERVPVDIRILGPDIDWASDPGFPRLSELNFGPSPAFSDDPGAWVDELLGVEFASRGDHNFLRMSSGENGEYDIVVVTPRISDVRSGPELSYVIVGLGLTFLLLGYAAVSWLFKPIRAIRAGAEHIGSGNFSHRIKILGISHELRTPLSRLRLLIEFVDDEGKQQELKAELVEMEKIIVSLLEAERLNSRHAPLTRSVVRVRDLVDELIDDFFDRERGRIEINDRSGGASANIDEARVSLLLKNLVNNALQYSPDDSGPLELSIDTQGHELVLRVRDHGPGISAEQAEHIGEPFYRGDPSRTRNTGGTGLGLYLATLVARAHGGSLTLLDTGEPGACFEARLPL
jgi:signal transduction histidine kinase